MSEVAFLMDPMYCLFFLISQWTVGMDPMDTPVYTTVTRSPPKSSSLMSYVPLKTTLGWHQSESNKSGFTCSIHLPNFKMRYVDSLAFFS